MSAGVMILVGILGTFAVVGFLQWTAARVARRAEGEPTPDLPGPLG